MRYSEFEYILLEERLKRYLLACDGDTRKTMALIDWTLTYHRFFTQKFNTTILLCLTN